MKKESKKKISNRMSNRRLTPTPPYKEDDLDVLLDSLEIIAKKKEEEKMMSAPRKNTLASPYDVPDLQEILKQLEEELNNSAKAMLSKSQ